MIERARRSFDHDLDVAKNHRPEAAIWLPPHRSLKVTAGPPGPLPPIVQWGQPRSGSTFQYTLLCLIAKMRGRGTSPEPTCNFAPTLSADMLQPNTVFKTHRRPPATSNYSLFVSHGDERLETSGLPEPVVVQTLARNKDLLNEVDRYRAAFGLSPDETEHIYGYMRYWSILRRCCGLQQSKYNRLRLHGCAVPIAVDSLEFPMCEAYNLTEVEVLFTQTRLYSYLQTDGQHTPGTCEADEQLLRGGLEFSGTINFTSCESILTRHPSVFGTPPKELVKDEVTGEMMSNKMALKKVQKKREAYAKKAAK